MYGDVPGWGSDRYFLNKKQILLGMTQKLSIGVVYGKKNPTLFKVAEKTIGSSLLTRADNLSSARWASLTNPKLGPGWSLILLARKNRAKFGPARLTRGLNRIGSG